MRKNIINKTVNVIKMDTTNTNILTYLSHSAIPSYPPDVFKYPNFYKCKEYVYILNPGDMLYIPPKWFHWVFSYNIENDINVAFSFMILNEDICSKTNNPDILKNKPFTYHYDNDLENYTNSLEYIFKLKDDVEIIKSKNVNLYPENKIKTDNITKEVLKLSDLNKILSDQYNFVVGQESLSYIFNKTPSLKPPEYLQYLLNINTESLKYKPWLWISYSKECKKNNKIPINTGLHYDDLSNFIFQIKGIKVVRLYSPLCHSKLYVKPFVIKQ